MPEFVNTETGEVHLVAIAQRRLHTQPFVMLFQDTTLDLLLNRGRTLTALEWRVLIYMLATATYVNNVEGYICEIATELGHDRSSVSKALRVLEKLELIHRGLSIGNRPQPMQIDPNLAFRGTATQRGEMLQHGWPPRSDTEH